MRLLPFPVRERFRMGLARKATVFAAALMVLIAVVTLTAHWLRSDFERTREEFVATELVRVAAYSDLADRTAICYRSHQDFKEGVLNEVSRHKALVAWTNGVGRLRSSATAIEADSGASQREAVQSWLSELEAYATAFKKVADDVDAGAFSSSTEIGAALRVADGRIRRLVVGAQSMARGQRERAGLSAEAIGDPFDSQTRLINVRAVASVLAIVLAGIWFRRLLTRLRLLAEAASRLAAGESDTRLRADDADELGDFAAALNRIACVLADRQRETIEARGAIRVEDGAKNELLAAVAKELRAPLSAATVHADMLLARADHTDCWPAASTVKHHCEYALEVVDEIRDLARIGLGQLSDEMVECSPRELVDDVVSRLRARAEAKGLELDVQWGDRVPARLHANVIRLKHLLFDLVANAIRMTEIGSVRLTVGGVETLRGKTHLHVDVFDTGAGFNSEEIARLTARARPPGAGGIQDLRGVGLTLSIGKRLLESLGGSINVASDLGAGSTVSVSVPVRVAQEPRALPRPAGSAAPPPIAASKGAAFRILLAEDGPENQRLISFILRKAGADVTVVANGRDAVDLVLGGGKAPPFDLILMDMQMPVMDGYDATRAVRAGGYRGLIIAVTGHTMDYDRQKCLDAGCNDYLPKPLDRDRLLAAISRYVAAGAPSPSAPSGSAS